MRQEERFSALIDNVLQVIQSDPENAREFLQSDEVREFLRADAWHLVAVIQKIPAMAMELLLDDSLRDSIDSRYQIENIVRAAPDTLLQIQQDERLNALVKDSILVKSLLFSSNHFSDGKKSEKSEAPVNGLA